MVILISKFYDAVTDPFEGIFIDRTRTKLGRRRPYLLAGIFLIQISFFLRCSTLWVLKQKAGGLPLWL